MKAVKALTSPAETARFQWDFRDVVQTLFFDNGWQPASEMIHAAGATLQQLTNPDGDARCAITLDPTGRRPGQQPYQGVVPLAGESIAQVLENYLRQSEQIESRLWLAADENAAAGVLLQRLPQEGGAAKPDADAWQRAGALTATLTHQELLTLEAEALARRLYWGSNTIP